MTHRIPVVDSVHMAYAYIVNKYLVSSLWGAFGTDYERKKKESAK